MILKGLPDHAGAGPAGPVQLQIHKSSEAQKKWFDNMNICSQE